MRTTDSKANRLFIVLSGFFLTNALLANFVGAKIFSLEDTLGIQPVEWSILGVSGTLSFTAGVLLWPFVFVMTDIINEYFGRRGVRLISWVAVVFICYAFIAAYATIALAPAGFWVDANRSLGVPDIQQAFAQIFGQGLWIIVGSVTAFLIGPVAQLWVIPFMTDGVGADSIGSWFGTGTGRGIALIFTVAGLLGIVLTLLASRSRWYASISRAVAAPAEPVAV